MERQSAFASKKFCNCISSNDTVTLSNLQKDTLDRAACSSCDSSTNATNVPPTVSNGAESGAIGGRSPLASLTNRLPQSPAAAGAHFRSFARDSPGCGGNDGATKRSRVASWEVLADGDSSSFLTKRVRSHGTVAAGCNRIKRGKENSGGAARAGDTPTRWRDDSTDVVVAAAAASGAAGCDERSPTTQERSQQFYCTCERHGGTSPVRASEESDAMIGDYTAPCCLPLTKNLGDEMPHISPATAADLLRGQFDNIIESFHIVDCRFPYEYVGGHIQGAENICTEEQLKLRFVKEPLNPQTHCRLWRAGDKRRHVIVFHCEFSSHRAPNMWKLLRRLDREQNVCSFPGLYYPEMYVIEGGYKAFFNQFPELCDPQSYKPMRGPEYRSSKKEPANRPRYRRSRTRLELKDGCPPPTMNFFDDCL